MHIYIRDMGRRACGVDTAKIRTGVGYHMNEQLQTGCMAICACVRACGAWQGPTEASRKTTAESEFVQYNYGIPKWER